LLHTAFRSKVCSQSYGAPKSRKSQLTQFRDSHLGVEREKSHLDVGFLANHRVYYKGEGGGFPQVWAVVSLMCSCCPWFVLAPRVLQLCNNHFVGCVQARVNEWRLSTFPSPVLELQHTPLPFKVLWAREHASTPPSFVVFYLDSHLNPSRGWECIMWY
jgi:hypothetical protein